MSYQQLSYPNRTLVENVILYLNLIKFNMEVCMFGLEDAINILLTFDVWYTFF